MAMGVVHCSPLMTMTFGISFNWHRCRRRHIYFSCFSSSQSGVLLLSKWSGRWRRTTTATTEVLIKFCHRKSARVLMCMCDSPGCWRKRCENINFIQSWTAWTTGVSNFLWRLCDRQSGLYYKIQLQKLSAPFSFGIIAVNALEWVKYQREILMVIYACVCWQQSLYARQFLSIALLTKSGAFCLITLFHVNLCCPETWSSICTVNAMLKLWNSCSLIRFISGRLGS